MIVNGFSAYHISSQGLKYALAFSSFEDEEVKEEEYKKALLNVLTAQDFDSIPLVEYYEGPITAIGRRRLHDGDHDDVFILSTEEVSKLPQTASVIRCIFEVLSNEHHIVFLTDEEDQIQDVVTIGMLSSPIIQEYLTLLVSKLSSENWDFNEKYLNSPFTPTYDFPKIIHQELKELGKLVDNPDGAIPTDFDISKQIVHILSLLQPLKHWEGGQTSDSLLSTDFPLTIATPDYKPGTAGYFAQHPFGAVMLDAKNQTIQHLAFKLFSHANNWDQLLLFSENDKKYTHIIEQGKEDVELNKLELLGFVHENQHVEELVHLFDDNHRPLCVEYKNSKYPGIISVQDIVYSEYNKTEMLSSLLNLEICIRDKYLHFLGSMETRTSNSDYFVGNEPVWKAKIAGVYSKLVSVLPNESFPFTKKKFQDIMRLRNSMAHNDFSLSPNDEADPKKTGDYLKFLQEDTSKIDAFGKMSTNYTEFAQVFFSEFKGLSFVKGHFLREITASSFTQSFVQLRYINNEFNLYFKNKNVVLKAQIARRKLQERNLPWKCRIYHWPSNESGAEIEAEITRKLAEAEAAKKRVEAEAEAARKQVGAEAGAIVARIINEMPSVLKKNIQVMVAREADKDRLIEAEFFRKNFRKIILATKTEFGFKENQYLIDAGFTPSSLKNGTGGVLTWSGFDYEVQIKENIDGTKTKFFRINP